MKQYQLSTGEKKFISWHLLVAILALAVGSLFGPLQAFEHAGWDFYPYLKPLIKSYYQGLTVHGVLNALVWTTFFIMGFLTFNVMFGLKRPLKNMTLNKVGFWLMVVGVVAAAIPILANQATVLFTFYPPLKANWAFYLGLTLVVVGSWVEGWGLFMTYIAWRKENPNERTPFIAFASIITALLWQICTLGIATEILTMLLPWSLGLIENVDPQLARTYFWFTGHPLVYFWLLPAYISWYAMLPEQAGKGKMFSDSLARLSFWIFLVLSTPLGFHHQYVDPGIPPAWKFLHSMLTFGVFFPSMMTAFTVVASLEHAGRKNGGKGALAWIGKLNWSDPSVAAQLLAGILFFFGGIGGLANASYNVNLVLHNTAFIPGHFHLTVATGVTLSFMGISYWLLPYLTGKKLWNPKVAVAQAWTWFVGMIIFSNSMHVLGLLGAPRRVPLGLAPYVPAEWNSRLFQVGVGGAILFISGALYLTVMLMTALNKEKVAEEVTVPIAESMQDLSHTPEWLDRWAPWVYGTLALIVIVYGPQLFDMIKNIALTSPGFRVW
ncbi:MAG: b(o/a)3-type cytochrome-c oxidase subunit 1 [Anaerolineales bacterium]|uniref:b(o/a)3-type cytochrome-c oxidase subunit 1 n=1 Tax=Candidatus Villigracilis proximus TaxID=3140683 RepID=UPI003135A307|nr:b(o/a)3-type cytochrome-c oxidase subunit 1 [Anaerolineales bacterium]